MKTYLVTGGAGFIGSNFIEFLMGKYEDIKIVNLDKLTYAGNLENLKAVERDKRYCFEQGDVCDVPFVESLFAQHKFDYVIHFAAESHVDRSIMSPDLFVQTNVIGTLNLLHCAKRAWAAGKCFRSGVKFLQVSTDEVYGSLGGTGYFTENTLLSPHNPYSASKASADLLVASFADTYGFPINITRCTNTFGPYQFPEKLIPLMIYNALHHEKLPIYGDGMQVRDWLFVTDSCKAIDLVLREGRPGEVYNVGGHNERSNLEIVKIILAYIRKHADPLVSEALITHVSDRKGHDRRYGINPEKMERELGWKPETSFGVGIEITIQWYLDNRAWLQSATSGEYQRYYKNMYLNRE